MLCTSCLTALGAVWRGAVRIAVLSYRGFPLLGQLRQGTRIGGEGGSQHELGGVGGVETRFFVRVCVYNGSHLDTRSIDG